MSSSGLLHINFMSSSFPVFHDDKSSSNERLWANLHGHRHSGMRRRWIKEKHAKDFIESHLHPSWISQVGCFPARDFVVECSRFANHVRPEQIQRSLSIMINSSDWQAFPTLQNTFPWHWCWKLPRCQLLNLQKTQPCQTWWIKENWFGEVHKLTKNQNAWTLINKTHILKVKKGSAWVQCEIKNANQRTECKRIHLFDLTSGPFSCTCLQCNIKDSHTLKHVCSWSRCKCQQRDKSACMEVMSVTDDLGQSNTESESNPVAPAKQPLMSFTFSVFHSRSWLKGVASAKFQLRTSSGPIDGQSQLTDTCHEMCP